jgi:hypothetical protein
MKIKRIEPNAAELPLRAVVRTAAIEDELPSRAAAIDTVRRAFTARRGEEVPVAALVTAAAVLDTVAGEPRVAARSRQAAQRRPRNVATAHLAIRDRADVNLATNRTRRTELAAAERPE